MKKGNTRSQAALDARRPSPGLSHAHASTNVHCTGDCHSIRMRQWRKRDTHLPSVPWTCALSLGRSHPPPFPGRAPCRWDGATHSASLDVRPLAVAGIAGRRCKHRSVRPSLHDRSDVCRLWVRVRVRPNPNPRQIRRVPPPPRAPPRRGKPGSCASDLRIRGRFRLRAPRTPGPLAASRGPRVHPLLQPPCQPRTRELLGVAAGGSFNPVLCLLARGCTHSTTAHGIGSRSSGCPRRHTQLYPLGPSGSARVR